MVKNQILNDFEHALLRPDTFIGSVDTVEKDMWIFDEDSSKILNKNVSYNPGLMNIIREIGSNCIDNKWRSEKDGIKMNNIIIYFDIDSGEISFTNDGYTIPVKKEEFQYNDQHSKKVISFEAYPAEVYFGRMRAGTNFDDSVKSKTSGKNGMGAKAANVFSSAFTVEHSSPENGMKFFQLYENNGKDKDEPEIEETNESGYTKISFIPDYDYFNYHNFETLYSLVKSYAYEIAMITGINVSFNDEEISVKSLEKYARLFYPDKSSRLYSFKASSGDECILVESPDSTLDTSPDIRHISFVNGISTKRGGIHVDKWRDSIIGGFVKFFNVNQKKKKANKDLKVTAKDLYPYFTLFVRSEIIKPKFDSQTKENLVGMKSGKSYVLSSKEDEKIWKETLQTCFEKISKWDFTSYLTDKLLLKIKRVTSKKEGSSSKRLNLGSKLKEANWAGGKKSSQCILCITEGDSAKAFADAGIGASNEHNRYGSLALRGKVLNAVNATRTEITGNKEIQQIKNVLGLRSDADYNDDEQFSELRYGSVEIMTDADDDGIHIKGLVLAFFFHFWPELYNRGYIKAFNTAAVQITKNKKIIHRFYSNSSFKRWSDEQEDLKSYQIMYLKGLGSIYPSDIPSYFNDKKIIDFFLEDDTKNFINVGFNKKFIDERKEWMLKDIDEFEAYEEKFQGELSVSEFVDYYLKEYHIMTLERAIPGLDGFKEVQRKGFYGIRSKNYKEEKIVAQAVGEACVQSGYHHGSKSMEDTIVKMAQSFVGSMNNIPLLKQGGSFGSRNQGGSDASASRYIRTCLEDIAKIIFDPSDDPILEKLVQDGVKVEYKFFAPIVPMVLINGVKGIATGFSTEIPCYNPYDIIEWIKTWLTDKSEVENFEYLIPFHFKFTGEINLIFEDDDGPPTGYISKGLIEPSKKGWWRITELPLGVWTQELEEKLGYFSDCNPPEGKRWKKLEKRRILDYNNYSTPNTVNYEIKPTKDFDIENWDILTRKYSLKNMTIVDERKLPKKFKSVEEILHYYCHHRLSLYKQRKEYQLYQLEKDLCKVSNKCRFIEAVVNEKINFEINEGDVSIEKQLEKLEFEKVDGTFDYLVNISIITLLKKNKADQLKVEKESLQNKIISLESKSSEDLWLTDLETFERAYDKYVEERA